MTRWTGVVTWVAGAALLAGCGAGDGDDAGDAGQTSSTTETTSIELTVPAATGGRCMAPNVENLQAQDAAFEGTVTDMVDGTVTLDVSQTYTGPEVETVTVAAPSGDLAGLLPAVDFQQGETYLVSSLDGQVSLCGLSGSKGDLADLYQEAYAD